MPARIDEIAPGVHRICVYVPEFQLQFNHFLIKDDEPLLFHCGLRAMFPLVREAVGRVMDPSKLRWIAFSHFESDECGALNQWLELAPSAALILLAGDHRSSYVAAVVGALVVSLGAANLLGCWVAAAARSVAEAALFAAVAALLLLHGAGTFRTPMPGSTGAAIEVWVPFRLLHESLLAVGEGTLLPTSISWPIGVWATLSATAATVLLAPWLLARLSRPQS